ncbi:MAG: DUF4112 domain-containing protein [Myxococcota bacterium]
MSEGAKIELSAIAQAVDSTLDDAGIGAAPVALAERPAPAVGKTPRWAEGFVRLLDDGIRIPGTQLRFGLDGVLGMVLPVAGDAVTGVSSITLLFLALKERVPTVILAKMVLNILWDTLLGAIPFLGDAFDFVWKANRKNLELIELYRDDPDAEPSTADYVLVGVGIVLAVVSIALPFLVTMFLVQAGASLSE